MSIAFAASYRQLAATRFPELPPTYERLVEAMVERVAPCPQPWKCADLMGRFMKETLDQRSLTVGEKGFLIYLHGR